MSLVGKKYDVDGYDVAGFNEVVITEPLRTFTLFDKVTRVFPFRPNWATPVNEILEWKTDVLRARDGTEQRRDLRKLPRRGFEFSILVKGDLSSALETVLFGWQNRYFALPVWTDRGRLVADAATLDTTLYLDTDTLGFQPGGYAIVFYSESFYDVVNITAVYGDRITLVEGIETDWPAGTLVMPLIVGHLNVSVPTSRLTGSVVQAAVSLAGSGDTAWPNVPESSPGTLYDGIEVITDKPNWRNAINNEFTFAFDTVDAGVGPLAYYETEAVARVVRPFQWFLKSRQQIVEFRKLMGRLRGQSKTVWMPSWHDDFVVAASNHANQATLIVKGTWFHSFVGVDTSRDRLAIRLPNGTTVYRRITLTSPNYSNDTTTITLDSTLGTTVAPNDNSRVQLLLRCRLATDKIVIPWATDAISEPQTTFTTVKL